MEPTLHDGDIVVVREQEEVETGEIAIVLVNGEDATIKEVKESREGLTLYRLGISKASRKRA